MDLKSLVRLPESKTLEFKRDLSSPAPVLRTVCAFANTAGGSVVLGVEDRSGTVTGIEDPLDAEERLASMIADGISPLLIPDIDLLAWRDTHVLIVRIHLGHSRPYHLRSAGPEAGTYVRVGSTNRRADSQLVGELARTARGQSYDELPMHDVDVDGIDVTAIAEAFAGSRSISKADLKTLRLVTSADGRDVATVGGVLLFGRERERHFPDARLQLARFKGVTKTHVIDSADLRTYPALAIEQAIAFIARNTALAYEFAGARRLEVPEYPPEAVREAVVNAVVHSDYSHVGSPVRVAIYDDRLEVESPGLLVPGLTIPDMLDGVSKVRNRAIARVFRELGLIEQWGSGIRRMIESCRAGGLPDPRIEETASGVRVTLWSGRAGATPASDPVDAAVLAALRDADGLSTAEVAQRIGRTPRAALTRLKRLTERGLVVQLGSAPNDPHRRYYVAEDPARYGR